MYETTLPVGTTRDRFGPMLAAGSGLELDRDLFLAFSPERVLVGRVLLDLQRYPKIVGGTSAESTRRAVEFYRSVARRGDRGLGRGRCRDRGDGQAGRDDVPRRQHRLRQRARALRRAPTGSTSPRSSARPTRSRTATSTSRASASAATASRSTRTSSSTASRTCGCRRWPATINDAMAGFAVDTIEDRIGSLDGQPVLVLGIAYRGDVQRGCLQLRLPPSRRASRGRGARPRPRPVLRRPITSASSTSSRTSSAPAFPCASAILQAAHEAYRSLDPAVLPGLELFVDGRNALERDPFERAGVRYVGIGR